MSDTDLFEAAFHSLRPDDERMRTWLALVGSFTSVERSLRRRFKRVFNSSLPRYDVLTALVQFPDGLTMGQLASKLMVSKGNVTGVVGRLQERNLVQQATSPQDRRVHVVTLTASGRELWDQMYAEYRAVIDDLLSLMSKAQAQALTQGLTQMREKVDTVLRQAEAPK